MFSSQIYCVTFVNHRCTGGFTYFALHFIHATFCIEPRKFPPTDSINSMNTYYIRQRISERIAASDIVLGIAGIYASYSDWMKWELDKAIEKGVPIIGVIPRGQERISAIVNDRADEIVHWNTESIVSAIRKHAK